MKNHMLKTETKLINAGPADEGEAALSQRGDLLGKKVLIVTSSLKIGATCWLMAGAGKYPR